MVLGASTFAATATRLTVIDRHDRPPADSQVRHTGKLSSPERWLYRA